MKPVRLLILRASNALLRHPRFKIRRNKAIETHAQNLAEIFNHLLGRYRIKITANQCRNLICQAAEMANLVRSTSTVYVFNKLSINGKGTREPVNFKAEFMSLIEVVDIDTIKPVKNSCEGLAGRDGFIGEVSEVIWHSLARAGDGDTRRMVLVKPKVLVKFFEPLPRTKKRRTT